MILEIPLHQGQVRHSDHVPVRVMSIGFGSGVVAADGCAVQAVAVLAWLNEARLVVLVEAYPVAIRSSMSQLQEIADRIVFVPLGVAAHGLSVVGMRQAYSESVIPGGLRLSCLPDVFAPLRGDQAIDRVVAIVIARRHDLIAEVDRLLGAVFDVSNVAAGVVGVAQVL